MLKVVFILNFLTLFAFTLKAEVTWVNPDILLGVDINNNGIRDDVDTWIKDKKFDKPFEEIVTIYLQKISLTQNDEVGTREAKEISDNYHLAKKCFTSMSYLYNEKYVDAILLKNEIINIVNDNKRRMDAYSYVIGQGKRRAQYEYRLSSSCGHVLKEETLETIRISQKDKIQNNPKGLHPLELLVMKGEGDLDKTLAKVIKIGETFSKEFIHSLLYKSIENGNLELTQFIINELSVDINIVLEEQNNPLQLAILYKKNDILKFLLSHHHLNLNYPFEYFGSYLNYAISARNSEAAKLLMLDSRIDVNALDSAGDTALITSFSKKEKDIFKRLINHKDIDVNIVDIKSGKYLAQELVRKMDLDYLKILMKNKNVVLNRLDNQKDPLLFYAIRNSLGYNSQRQEEIKKNAQNLLEYLLEETDVDVNLKNQYGVSALEYSVREGEIDTFKMILNHPKLKVEKKVIHQIVSFGDIKLLKTAISHPGFDVNYIDPIEKTALIKSVVFKKIAMIEVFLKHPKIDLSIKGTGGVTAFDLAKKSKDKRIIALFESHMEKD